MTTQKASSSDQEARLRAVAVLAAVGIEVDAMRGILRAGMAPPATLRPQSMAVLLELAACAGQVVPRARLFGAVWGTRLVTDDSLVQCVLEIRRALGPEAAGLLRTLPRRGYLFDVARAIQSDGLPTQARTTASAGWLPVRLPAEALLIHADGDAVSRPLLTKALRRVGASRLKVLAITCVAIQKRRLKEGLGLTIAAEVQTSRAQSLPASRQTRRGPK